MPRNIMPALQASTTWPPSIWTSTRRCPSMRVMGSMATRWPPGEGGSAPLLLTMGRKTWFCCWGLFWLIAISSLC